MRRGMMGLALVACGILATSAVWAVPVISDSFGRPDSATGLGATDQGYAWQIINWNGPHDWAPGIKNGKMWWEAGDWNQNNPVTLTDTAAILKNFTLDLDYVTLEETGANRGITIYFRVPMWQTVDNGGASGYGVVVKQANYNNVQVSLYNGTYGISQAVTVFTGGPGCHVTIQAMDNNIKIFINGVSAPAIDFYDTTANPGKTAAGCFAFHDGNGTDRQGFDNLVISSWPAPTISDSFNRADSVRDLGSTEQGYAWQIVNWNGINDWAPGIKDGRMWWAPGDWNRNNPIALTNAEANIKNFTLDLDFVTNSITGGSRPLSINFRTPQGSVIESGSVMAGYSVTVQQNSYNWVGVSLQNPGYGVNEQVSVNTGGPGCHVTVVAQDAAIKVFINNAATPAIDFTDTTDNPGKSAAGYFAFYDGNAADQQGFDNLVIVRTPSTVAPTLSRNSGYLGEAKEIVISCANPEATIRYTIDGTDPAEANGTVIVSGATVPVDHSLTLKARAWLAGNDGSDIASATYTFPTTLNRPNFIAQGTAAVDGLVTEWTASEWTLLDQIYDITASSEAALNADIPEAWYAARWSADKIYVAVKVRDTGHFFTDGYTTSTGRDAVEIYLHTTGAGPVAYWDNQLTAAQQYAMGVKDTDHSQLWTVVGGTGIPEGFTAKATLGADGWIYYETEITPFEYFGGFSGRPSVVSPLSVNDIIGLDVVVVANHNGTYAGMKGENTAPGKWNDYSLFGIHKLVAAVPTPTPTPAFNPGDANGDGAVDVSDLGILAANYGTTGTATWAMGDFNGDTNVDVSDLGILAANYGFGTGAALDFNRDAQALGLKADDTAKADATVGTGGLCGSAGLPMIAGLLLMGILLVKIND